MVYSWITVDLIDPDNGDDLFDLGLVFSDTSLEAYEDSIPNTPFVFLIHKHEETKENDKTLSLKTTPIGFISLTRKRAEDTLLWGYYGMIKKEQGKGQMKWALEILNYKLLGMTTETLPNKLQYEQLLKKVQLCYQVPTDAPQLNHLSTISGVLLGEGNHYNYYFSTLKRENLYQTVEKDQMIPYIVLKNTSSIIRKDKIYEYH